MSLLNCIYKFWYTITRVHCCYLSFTIAIAFFGLFLFQAAPFSYQRSLAYQPPTNSAQMDFATPRTVFKKVLQTREYDWGRAMFQIMLHWRSTESQIKQSANYRLLTTTTKTQKHNKPVAKNKTLQ